MRSTLAHICHGRHCLLRLFNHLHQKPTSTGNVIATTLRVSTFMCPLAEILSAIQWIPPSASDLSLPISIGITGTADICFITKAWAAADMSIIVPLDFLCLLIVRVAGWLLFNEPADSWTAARGVLSLLAPMLECAQKQGLNVESRLGEPAISK